MGWAKKQSFQLHLWSSCLFSDQKDTSGSSKGPSWGGSLKEELEVFRACPMGRRPQGRPGTHWRDYLFQVAWESLRISEERLKNIAGESNIKGHM